MAEFEIGDIVNVRGTVHHRMADGTYSLIIPYGAKGDGFRTQRNFEPDEMTLVERPVKFEVGKRYHFPNGIRHYMYLGPEKWYSYSSDEVIESNELDIHSLELMED